MQLQSQYGVVVEYLRSILLQIDSLCWKSLRMFILTYRTNLDPVPSEIFRFSHAMATPFPEIPKNHISASEGRRDFRIGSNEPQSACLYMHYIEL